MVIRIVYTFLFLARGTTIIALFVTLFGLVWRASDAIMWALEVAVTTVVAIDAVIGTLLSLICTCSEVLLQILETVV